MSLTLPPGIPSPGSHPGSGEPFVECDLRVERHDEVVNTLPPAPPSRTIDHYDEDLDAWVVDRARTDEEMAEATKRYEAALARWNRTGGEFVVAGASIIHGVFRCASGAKAHGILVNTRLIDEWRWLAWSTAPAAPLPRAV